MVSEREESRGWSDRCRASVEGGPSSNDLQRTEWNVRDSDGTVIFSVGKRLSGNSFETLEFAIKHRKPYLHLSAVFKDNAAQKLKKWIAVRIESAKQCDGLFVWNVEVANFRSPHETELCVGTQESLAGGVESRGDVSVDLDHFLSV